jgi:F-type H+-transporting ATPase subunit b
MDEHSSQAVVEVDASPHAKDASLMSPDATMLVLTWVTFFLLLAILQKFAWKPIVTALENRENYIRKSLEEADQIKSSFTDIQASKEKILSEAHKNAQDIIDQSRKRAQEVAKTIEERAKEHAQEILQSAHQQIEGERDRVKTALRRESADMAIGLAGKIMKENVDNDKNRKLIDQAIKEFKS